MSEREEERAAVVAWLRARQARYELRADQLYASDSDIGEGDHALMVALTAQSCADAIERGDHLAQRGGEG